MTKWTTALGSGLGVCRTVRHGNLPRQQSGNLISRICGRRRITEGFDRPTSDSQKISERTSLLP